MFACSIPTMLVQLMAFDHPTTSVSHTFVSDPIKSHKSVSAASLSATSKMWNATVPHHRHPNPRIFFVLPWRRSPPFAGAAVDDAKCCEQKKLLWRSTVQVMYETVVAGMTSLSLPLDRIPCGICSRKA